MYLIGELIDEHWVLPIKPFGSIDESLTVLWVSQRLDQFLGIDMAANAVSSLSKARILMK